MLQRLLKHPKKLGISLNFWDFLLIFVIVVSGIFLVQFLGRENLDVISSRELLRLTSTPHIRNEAPDAAVRGRPLKGLKFFVIQNFWTRRNIRCIRVFMWQIILASILKSLAFPVRDTFGCVGENLFRTI